MTQEPEKLTALTDFDDGPEAMLRRPELAAMIAAVASRATWIEDAFARLFVYLLNREEEAALSIYLNFFDNGVRLRVFNAVADTRLSEDDRKKFKKLHEQLATKLKPRNNLVHAWWVTSDKHPDALLLVEREEFHTSHFKYLHANFKDEDERLAYVSSIAQNCTIWKYTEKDFRLILDDLRDFQGEVEQFIRYAQIVR